MGEVEVAYHVQPGLHEEQSDVVEAVDPCIETVPALSDSVLEGQSRYLSACPVLCCMHYCRHCTHLDLERAVLSLARQYCVGSTLSGAVAFPSPQMPEVVGVPDFSGSPCWPLVSVLISDHIH